MPYIDEHKGSYGIEPICRTLAVAPSSYYAAKVRPPSARAVRDETLKAEISRIHTDFIVTDAGPTIAAQVLTPRPPCIGTLP